MMKLFLAAALALPLLACTTHDRRSYTAEPVKGSGLLAPSVSSELPPAEQPPLTTEQQAPAVGAGAAGAPGAPGADLPPQ